MLKAEKNEPREKYTTNNEFPRTVVIYCMAGIIDRCRRRDTATGIVRVELGDETPAGITVS